MKKNLSYRARLLELAQIYKISEVKNYLRVKKHLTVPQLELILKKNKVPIPTEIHKSLLEIQAQKIKKPFSSLGNKIDSSIKAFTKNINKFFLSTIKGINSFFSIITNGILNFFLFVYNSTINILNNIYNFKVAEKKANQIVKGASILTILLVFGMTTIVVFNKSDDTNLKVKNENKIEKKEPIKKAEPKKEIVKKTIKKAEPKKEIAKLPSGKKSDKLKELVLPNLNLKTETVLSLFQDVDYDLKTVRFEKKVMPIYFTQFPKDLDEIQSVKLKKETFLKIVLPLVVAENEKILDDRYKLITIIKKKKTSDNEKAWLRQKIREYKIKNNDITELSERMDIIPVSIALAQAAKESGWGTSRFALEGNAIFGQWTWNGKGIAPLSREKGLNHKILRFPILRASVKAYKNNLNTHKGYKKFRQRRAKLRSKRSLIKGLDLIHTLDSYAQTGIEYTKILEKIINQNSLSDFESVKLTNSAVKKELNL